MSAMFSFICLLSVKRYWIWRDLELAFVLQFQSIMSDLSVREQSFINQDIYRTEPNLHRVQILFIGRPPPPFLDLA